MSNFLSTLTGQNKTRLVLLAAAVAVVLFGSLKYALATTPSDKELSAEMLPGVIHEIDRTQEYADRNAAGKACEAAILACQTGDCTAFAQSDQCKGF